MPKLPLVVLLVLLLWSAEGGNPTNTEAAVGNTELDEDRLEAFHRSAVASLLQAQLGDSMSCRSKVDALVSKNIYGEFYGIANATGAVFVDLFCNLFNPAVNKIIAVISYNITDFGNANDTSAIFYSNILRAVNNPSSTIEVQYLAFAEFDSEGKIDNLFILVMDLTQLEQFVAANEGGLVSANATCAVQSSSFGGWHLAGCPASEGSVGASMGESLFKKPRMAADYIDSQCNGDCRAPCDAGCSSEIGIARGVCHRQCASDCAAVCTRPGLPPVPPGPICEGGLQCASTERCCGGGNSGFFPFCCSGDATCCQRYCCGNAGVCCAQNCCAKPMPVGVVYLPSF